MERETGTPITIRQAAADEYTHAYDVIMETFAVHQQGVPEVFRPTASPPPLPQVIARLLDEGGAFFVAQHAATVIGFLTIRLAPVPTESYLVPERRAIVDNLGVVAACRRRGVARELMEAAQTWARQHGARRVQLNVWEFNAGAIAFYEALGYDTANRTMWRSV